MALQACSRRAQVICRAAASPSLFRVNIQGKHLEVTSAIKEYCERKVVHALDPFKAAVGSVDIRLSVRGGDASRGERKQKVEVTIRTAHFGVVRAEEVQHDLYAAIDFCADKLSRSLRKLKEKAVKRGNWPGRGGRHGAATLADVLPAAESDGETEDEGVSEKGASALYAPSDATLEGARGALGEVPASIAKVKVFYLDQMSAEEAVDQLQQVDHDFYIYLDSDSGHVQVVYKRKDGPESGYGLIITIPDDASLTVP